MAIKDVNQVGQPIHFVAFMVDFIQGCIRVVKGVSTMDNIVILRGSVLFSLEVV